MDYSLSCIYLHQTFIPQLSLYFNKLYFKLRSRLSLHPKWMCGATEQRISRHSFYCFTDKANFSRYTLRIMRLGTVFPYNARNIIPSITQGFTVSLGKLDTPYLWVHHIPEICYHIFGLLFNPRLIVRLWLSPRCCIYFPIEYT